ncbi:MAG: hypothetical protein KME27_10125 [Lyngbya sp. HA4199-MV5]|jgi:hypothetical protein|nr:hypothetical protein [Lyngbya sp. HA4199-MV5]
MFESIKGRDYSLAKRGNARLGAACDFQIVGLESDPLMEWILEQQLLLGSLKGDR